MRIAVFDLDGTLTRRDLYLAFLGAAVRRLGPARPLRAAALPIPITRFLLRGIGNDRMKAAFLDALLGGRRRDAVDELAADFAARAVAREIKPAALACIAHHRRAGDAMLLATASLDTYSVPIARLLGFDGVVATQISWTAEDRVAGTLDGPNLRGAAKLDAVRREIAARFPGQPRGMVAYSDHESDAPLLEAADQAVAVDPTRALARIAEQRGWTVARWSGATGAQTTATAPIPADGPA